MLKMIPFMHLYCQQKLYIKMYFAAEILQYAFSKTGMSFGLYHKITAFCWIFAELAFLFLIFY